MAKEKQAGEQNIFQKILGRVREIVKGFFGIFKSLNPLTFFKTIAQGLRGFQITDKLRQQGKIALVGGVAAIAGIFFGILAYAFNGQIQARSNTARLFAATQSPEIPTPGTNLTGPELVRFNRLFNAFSPLAEDVFLQNLNMEDRNNNGVIDRGEDEGYEEFIAKYGNADRGYWVNGVIQGGGNGKLEEAEIINHYYLHIRYKFSDETEKIEEALNRAMREGDLPRIWMDDANGTVQRTVEAILRQNRSSWPALPVQEAEAERIFLSLLQGLRIRGLPGSTTAGGYVELPDFINRRAGYSAEVAHFAFWLFSRMQINTIPVKIMTSREARHEGIRFVESARVIDYFGSSDTVNLSDTQWQIQNPLQILGDYYFSQAQQRRNRRNAATFYEQALRYNKYSIVYAAALMEERMNNPGPSYPELIAMGEFILQSSDLRGIVLSKDPEAENVLASLGSILSILNQSYSILRDTGNAQRIAEIAQNYLGKEYQ